MKQLTKHCMKQAFDPAWFWLWLFFVGLSARLGSFVVSAPGWLVFPLIVCFCVGFLFIHLHGLMAGCFSVYALSMHLPSSPLHRSSFGLLNTMDFFTRCSRFLNTATTVISFSTFFKPYQITIIICLHYNFKIIYLYRRRL